MVSGAGRRWDGCGVFLIMSHERLYTEIVAESGAEERRSESVMMHVIALL